MLAIEETTSVETNIEDPTVYFISQNYPNPFNSETSIRFEISKPVYINIEIYNMLGDKITTLVAGHKDAGIHAVTWNGRNDSGEYFFWMIHVRYKYTRISSQ